MIGFVYILQSDSGRYYIGSTTNIERRIKQHRCGQTSTTKRFGNFNLVLSQEFDSLQAARLIERKIKDWKRKDFIDKIVKDQEIKIKPW